MGYVQTSRFKAIKAVPSADASGAREFAPSIEHAMGMFWCR